MWSVVPGRLSSICRSVKSYHESYIGYALELFCSPHLVAELICDVATEYRRFLDSHRQHYALLTFDLLLYFLHALFVHLYVTLCKIVRKILKCKCHVGYTFTWLNYIVS